MSAGVADIENSMDGLVGFGDLPPAVDALLQRGVAAYRTDKSMADDLFREAMALDHSVLPTNFCLYKIHCYSGRLNAARIVAEAGLEEAARQACWPADWRQWLDSPLAMSEPGRFALYTLKALAFIALKSERFADAEAMLRVLRRQDPTGTVGWTVIAELADALSV